MICHLAHPAIPTIRCMVGDQVKSWLDTMINIMSKRGRVKTLDHCSRSTSTCSISGALLCARSILLHNCSCTTIIVWRHDFSTLLLGFSLSTLPRHQFVIRMIQTTIFQNTKDSVKQEQQHQSQGLKISPWIRGTQQSFFCVLSSIIHSDVRGSPNFEGAGGAVCTAAGYCSLTFSPEPFVGCFTKPRIYHMNNKSGSSALSASGFRSGMRYRNGYQSRGTSSSLMTVESSETAVPPTSHFIFHFIGQCHCRCHLLDLYQYMDCIITTNLATPLTQIPIKVAAPAMCIKPHLSLRNCIHMTTQTLRS